MSLHYKHCSTNICQFLLIIDVFVIFVNCCVSSESQNVMEEAEGDFTIT